jgi:hypothetical protein
MNLKPNTYRVLEHAVESGVRYGYNRAFKYSDNPNEQQIIDAIISGVMTEIFEWFDDEEQEDDC